MSGFLSTSKLLDTKDEILAELQTFKQDIVKKLIVLEQFRLPTPPEDASLPPADSPQSAILPPPPPSPPHQSLLNPESQSVLNKIFNSSTLNSVFAKADGYQASTADKADNATEVEVEVEVEAEAEVEVEVETEVEAEVNIETEQLSESPDLNSKSAYPIVQTQQEPHLPLTRYLVVHFKIV